MALGQPLPEFALQVCPLACAITSVSIPIKIAHNDACCSTAYRGSLKHLPGDVESQGCYIRSSMIDEWELMNNKCLNRIVWVSENWGAPGLEEASSSWRLSRKVSLLRVTRKAGPKNSEPRSRMNASSGSASRVAELRLIRIACNRHSPINMLAEHLAVKFAAGDSELWGTQGWTDLYKRQALNPCSRNQSALHAQVCF